MAESDDLRKAIEDQEKIDRERADKAAAEARAALDAKQDERDRDKGRGK